MYCTQQDLVDRFGETELIQLTDTTGSGAIDATAVARAIADAEGEINTYLAKVVSLPLSPVPTIVTAAACDMARYRLYRDQLTEPVTQRYKDAIRLLGVIARGEIRLDAEAVTANSAAPRHSAPERVFTADTLSGF